MAKGRKRDPIAVYRAEKDAANKRRKARGERAKPFQRKSRNPYSAADFSVDYSCRGTWQFDKRDRSH